MNCFKTLVIFVAFLSAFLIGDLHGQNQPAAAEVVQTPAAESQTDIAAPDAVGVFPSIRHKGDIVDFLKFLGVACNKNIVPSSNVRGQVNVNLFNVTAKEVMDVVLISNGFAYEEKGAFIFVYTQKEYEAKLAAARKTVSRAFHLNYITAQDAETLIKPLLSEAGLVTTTPAAQTSQGGKGGSGETWAGNNYIVIVDYPEYIDAVEKLLGEVDRQPLQVLVEATIMTAELNDNNALGIDFNVLGGVDFQSSAGVFHPETTANVNLSGTETSASTGFTSNVGGGGLSIGIVKNNIGLFISALESVTDVVTLGNPKVLTLNRQEGKVIVGRRDGYITTEVSATTATQTVEFLETGTQLTFRPFVMDDGFIRMELSPKDSDGGVTVSGSFTLPWEKTSEITTNVLVKDGHSIVIGGLFREKTETNRSQVPLVGNIPLIGNLFRSTVDDLTKEEVIFIITPHIVKESVDYAAAEEALGTMDTIMIGAREGMQWHGRERLAGAHYNRARELQANGKLKAALWDANLAVHISPRFLDALDLRNELRAKHIYRGEYGCMRLFMGRLIEKNLPVAQSSVSFLDSPADFGLSPVPVALSDEEAEPVSQTESQTVDEPQIVDDTQMLDEIQVAESQVDEQQVVDSQLDEPQLDESQVDDSQVVDSQTDEPQAEEEQLEDIQLATEPTDEQF
ncbi:MAG: hypothetical protein KAT56_02215 [Sedimentisphaerales bacterium]|nr:hypothetical protein [Sedimentisphaerales bacterium]